MIIKFIISGLLGGLLFSNFLPAVEEEIDYGQLRVGTVYEQSDDTVIKKDPYNLGLITNSKIAFVVDKNSGAELLAKNETEVVPVASITKLMAALTFLDYEIEWEREVVYKKEYARDGSYVFLRPGERVSVKDIFYSALVVSANNAIAALVDIAVEDEDIFVEKMNKKAKELGMVNSQFYEPTGLSQHNKSTAKDLVRLIEAVTNRQEIADALNTQTYQIEILNSSATRKLTNNDDLLTSFINEGVYRVLGGKTGYTNEAGFCMLMAVEKEGRVLYIVVLGAHSEQERFQEAKALAYWAFENHEFK